MKKADTNTKKQSYFAKVKPEKFRNYLKAKYYGEVPFDKSQSYKTFVTRENEKHYLNNAIFTEYKFTYRYLANCARQLGIKATSWDREIAFNMFFGIQKEAESIKCKHCCGHGYVSKTIAYGSKAYKA